MKWVYNRQARQNNDGNTVDTSDLSVSEANKVRTFHQSFNQYAVTPLRRLSHLAKYLGVADVFVKDESYRFGLNAFKVLGGTYAIGKYLADRLGKSIDEVTFDDLRSDEAKKQLGELTFISATDGNHGRGVAWAAQQLGQKAIIYMPKGSSPIRLKNIRATGAEASITEHNYDDTVRMCADLAEKNGWIIVQDTAWEGYETIPTWIMKGYLTMVDEAVEQLKAYGVEKPTHIFLQAGVGTYPAAIQGYFHALYGEKRPTTVIVEPDEANCFYLSALDAKGKARRVTGDLNTIMAGLACGEPNPKAWEILSAYSDMFVSCPDAIAAQGMRILGNPLGDDPRVVSGESGAVPLGLLRAVMQDASLDELRKQLQLGPDSRVLLFSTEGDTDPEHYRKIVWDGMYPKNN